MPARKGRVVVVLDTNIVIANYLGRDSSSPVKRIFGLWRKQRRLQLVVSEEILSEYLMVLDRANVPSKAIAVFSERIHRRRTVSIVSLGKRARESRDSSDNVFLSTAMAGKAEFLITNDNDLLEIAESEKNKFKFQIVTPAAFLKAIGD